MHIENRIDLIEDMLHEQAGQLAVTLPAHSVEVLLDYCRDRMDIKADYLQMRTQMNYYKERYKSAAANEKRLQAEVRNGQADISGTAESPRRHRQIVEA